MAVWTTSDLVSKIHSYLFERDDLATRIGDFIELAEAQLQRRLRSLEQLGRAEATANSEYVAVPSDFAGIISIELRTSPPTPIERRDPAMLATLKSVQPATGAPVFFGLVGQTLQLVPAPDQPYTIDLTYSRRFTPLSSANPTNWILENHPDAYLYGALLQSAPWLHEDERVPVWEGIFKTIIADINGDARLSSS